MRWTGTLAIVFAALSCPTDAATTAQTNTEPPVTIEPHLQLQEILEKPIYQRWKLRQERELKREESGWGKALSEMIDRMFEGLGNLINRWLQGITPRQKPSWFSGFSIIDTLKIIAWAALILITLLLGIVVYKHLTQPQGVELNGRVLTREQVREALDQGAALKLDTPRWLQEASRLGTEGEFRAVYRALYLALLSGLHSDGKIDFRRNRTNWNYVSKFDGPDEQRTVFDRLTRLFDDVWYGHKTADRREMDRARSEVISLVGGGPSDV